MPFNPEHIASQANPFLPKPKAERRQELSDELSVLAGWLRYSRRDEEDLAMTKILAAVPEAERQGVLDELTEISQSLGWKRLEELSRHGTEIAKEIKDIVEKSEENERLYSHRIKTPQEVKTIFDFKSEDPEHWEAVANWIPRKYDIRKYLEIALKAVAHDRGVEIHPHFNPRIRIADIGGGSGFLGRLLADEGKALGLNVDVTVIDPDKDAIERAQEAHKDCKNLKFEIGDSADAVRKHNRLNKTDWAKVKKLQEDFENKKQEYQKELYQIIALEEALENLDQPMSILDSPFGEKGMEILSSAKITSLDDLENVRNQLMDYSISRTQTMNEDLAAYQDQQEKFYVKGGSADFDLVINSWMPHEVDFSRDLRKLNAPAIIYALETGGSTGIYTQGSSLGNLGEVSSYEARNNYQNSSVRWEGLATTALPDIQVVRILGRMPYHGSIRNETVVHTKKGFNLKESDLKTPHPKDDDKYPWEKTLEQLVGKDLAEKDDFGGR